MENIFYFKNGEIRKISSDILSGLGWLDEMRKINSGPKFQELLIVDSIEKSVLKRLGKKGYEPIPDDEFIGFIGDLFSETLDKKPSTELMFFSKSKRRKTITVAELTKGGSFSFRYEKKTRGLAREARKILSKEKAFCLLKKDKK